MTDTGRSLAATGVLLSAVVHLDLWDNGFRDVHVIGNLFLLNVIGGIAIGTLTVVWRHWFPALLAAGYGLTTVVFFWISVVYGLFGVKETATGSLEVLAQVAEYAAIAFGLAAAMALRPASPTRLRLLHVLHAS